MVCRSAGARSEGFAPFLLVPEDQWAKKSCCPIVKPLYIAARLPSATQSKRLIESLLESWTYQWRSLAIAISRLVNQHELRSGAKWCEVCVHDGGGLGRETKFCRRVRVASRLSSGVGKCLAWQIMTSLQASITPPHVYAGQLTEFLVTELLANSPSGRKHDHLNETPCTNTLFQCTKYDIDAVVSTVTCIRRHRL